MEKQGTFTYFIENGKATIVNCDRGAIGDIIIPPELGGCPVDCLDDETFCKCKEITGLTIPDSVTDFSAISFPFKNRLRYIDVDEKNPNYSSVDGVLFDKNQTTLIRYPAGNKRTSYIIPDGVTRIEDEAFASCINLSGIILPDSVKSIGHKAFKFCCSLRSIRIPDNVTKIGNYVFIGCLMLTDIEFSAGVSDAAEAVLYSGSNLVGFHVDENNSNYSSIDGVLFDKTQTLLIRCPSGHSRTRYVIPDGVTRIGDRAFDVCEKLTDVRIPDSVASIGRHAFSYCRNLHEISIPASVTFIGEYAFSVVTNLKNIYYAGTPEQWQSIDFGYGNNCLKNATVHYNCNPDGEPEEDAETDD